MTQPWAWLDKTVHTIDTFTEWTGGAVAWLSVPLALGLTYEVISRYVFDSPTIWVFDSTYMIYSTLFMLGASYALLKGGHIRTDMLWQNWSVKRRAYIDFWAYLLFYFPGITMWFLAGLDDAIYSFSIWERSEQTAWRPPIWPLKAVIPVAMLMLLIQGVSEFLKSLHAIRTGQVYEKKEGYEV